MDVPAFEGCRFGLEKVSMNDYPGRPAAVLFIPGCNLRCPYCHNGPLVTPPFPENLVSFAEAAAYLRKRSKVLGGVCLSGGEPTLFPEIKALIEAVQDLGYPVKLDTNGLLPERLKPLRPDFIAMDVKTSPHKYRLLGTADGGRIRQSIEQIKASGIPHQFRTTVVPGITEEADLDAIAELTAGSPWVLHNFRNNRCLAPAFEHIPPLSDALFRKLCGRYTPDDRSLILR